MKCVFRVSGGWGICAVSYLISGPRFIGPLWLEWLENRASTWRSFTILFWQLSHWLHLICIWLMTPKLLSMFFTSSTYFSQHLFIVSIKVFWTQNSFCLKIVFIKICKYHDTNVISTPCNVQYCVLMTIFLIRNKADLCGEC